MELGDTVSTVTCEPIPTGLLFKGNLSPDPNCKAYSEIQNGNTYCKSCVFGKTGTIEFINGIYH